HPPTPPTPPLPPSDPPPLPGGDPATDTPLFRLVSRPPDRDLWITARPVDNRRRAATATSAQIERDRRGTGIHRHRDRLRGAGDRPVRVLQPVSGQRAHPPLPPRQPPLGGPPQQ